MVNEFENRKFDGYTSNYNSTNNVNYNSDLFDGNKILSNEGISANNFYQNWLAIFLIGFAYYFFAFLFLHFFRFPVTGNVVGGENSEAEEEIEIENLQKTLFLNNNKIDNNNDNNNSIVDFNINNIESNPIFFNAKNNYQKINSNTDIDNDENKETENNFKNDNINNNNNNNLNNNINNNNIDNNDDELNTDDDHNEKLKIIVTIENLSLWVKTKNLHKKNLKNNDTNNTTTKTSAINTNKTTTTTINDNKSSSNEKLLLKDIHATMRPGRLVALMGGSGSGFLVFIYFYFF
jgi:ABC-type multidrug transport system fused ATPase/permease subunit